MGPLLLVLGLLAAACGSTAPTATTPSTAAATAAPSVDGPPAPDFTLALGNGGEFTLSRESKPVYMVFWAEW